MRVSREVELKLEADNIGIDLLARAPIFATADVKEQEQASTYFDTPEHDLRKAGLSLRIRKIETRRIQTLKAENEATTGLFARGEWEMPIRQDHPVVSDARMPLQAMVPALRPERLVPVFEIVVTRRKRLIVRDGTKIELALDRGEVRAGGATRPISEIELELKSGSLKVLFGLARDLGQLAPLELSTQSKAQRGYELVGRDSNAYINAVNIHLASVMSVATAFQTTAFACLRHFLLNRSIFCRNQNPEALHQQRIALRRLRSAISIFQELLPGDRPAHLRGELRWIAAEMDTARDLDVLLASANDEAMRTPLRLAQAQAYAGACAALTSPRLRCLILDMVEWITVGNWLTIPIDKWLIDRPIGSFAPDALDRCHREVERRGRRWKRLDDAKLHRLRISVKKLHYAADFFGTLFPGEKAGQRRKVFRSALTALQEHLGDLHDRITGATLLAKLGIADTRKHTAARKPMRERAAQAYEMLVDAKRFW